MLILPLLYSSEANIVLLMLLHLFDDSLKSKQNILSYMYKIISLSYQQSEIKILILIIKKVFNISNQPIICSTPYIIHRIYVHVKIYIYLLV